MENCHILYLNAREEERENERKPQQPLGLINQPRFSNHFYLH